MFKVFTILFSQALSVTLTKTHAQRNVKNSQHFRGNERSKGNGLGLYIVSKAVEKLRGKLSLQSEVHKGSVFTITFPENQMDS